MRSRPNAVWLAVFCSLAMGIACPLGAQEKVARVRMLVQSSPLAGFRHSAAEDVWAELRQGDRLTLVREPDNEFDPNAIRVEWQGRKLGYVPRKDNAALAWALDRGETLHARISRSQWHANPARRIVFQVFVE
jgi:hypothetical protein